MPLRFAVLAGLTAAVVAVFVVLPRWVDQRRPAAPVVVEAPPPELAEPDVPAYSDAELEALQAQADRLLARLLNQQSQLDRRSAAAWAGGDYRTYQELSRTGDDAYLADAYFDAVDAYRQALELGEAMLARSVDLVDSVLAAARQAFEAGNAAVAVEQYSLVLSIEPAHAAALAGLRRAERLPDVLALMQEGAALERSGDFEGAARAYREAVAIDGGWAPARSALDSTVARIDARRFDALMSDGLNAMATEEFEAAYELFSQALALRPGSRDALNARTQAEQGRHLERIALLEARALAFERRERWQDAIHQYRDALQTDPTLAFAQEGEARATYRLDLDLKLHNLIANPGLLFDDAVLDDARRLLAEARQAAPSGPRLGEQLATLETLIRQAATPFPVQFQSDERTEVALYRVGRLGQFLVKDLELRPGTYTVVGSRPGFRDVRSTFTVLPGRPLDPIRVECVERVP